MIALEKVFIEHSPHLVVVYGDVNSTLAAALVAAKLGIPLAHVEAGLRSFDRTMPEELNRILTDSLSDVLLTTSPDANVHLGREGITEDRIHFVGNPMIDSLEASREAFDGESILREIGIRPEDTYFVATLHRPANVDDPRGLRTLVEALAECTALGSVVLPMHPRGASAFRDSGALDIEGLHLIDPQGYLEFMGLMSGAAAVITDSGGVQEETTKLGVPCFTLRPNTERPITISHGTNSLVTAETLYASVSSALAQGGRHYPTPPLWDGHAGERIAAVLASFIGASER